MRVLLMDLRHAWRSALRQPVATLSIIALPALGIGGITAVFNPEMPPEVIGDKFCRLDINMTVDGQLVDLEI